MNAKKANWVNGLDSIRFILAFIVLLSHIHNPFTDLLKHSSSLIVHVAGLLSEHLFCGAAAVTGFFIISGFVIHYPNKDQMLNVTPFLIRRWVRIGIPMIVVSAIAWQYHLFSSLPMWSLYCELFYYTLYPLLFRLKSKWVNKLYISYAIAAIFIVFLIAVGVGAIPSGMFRMRGLYWYICIAMINLPCWLLGVLLAERIDNITKPVSLQSLWMIRGIAYLLSMMFLALKAHYHINYTYSLVVFALLLYKWLQMEIVYRRSHPAHFSEYLGKFSYSLYLCHVLGFALFNHFWPTTIYTYFVEILCAIGVSYIAYLFIEYPSHKLAQRLASAVG